MRWLVLIAAWLLGAPAHGSVFCDGAPRVAMSVLDARKTAMTDARLQTEAVLATDLKEWGYIASADKPAVVYSLASDQESERYRSSHSLVRTLHDAFVDEYQEATAQRPSQGRSPDPAKVTRFRLKLSLCGRLVRQGVSFAFVVDDFAVDDRYFVDNGYHKAAR